MYDLIIVGGGISGLYLYYKLIHSGKKIILLEGILHSDDNHPLRSQTKFKF